MSTMVTSHVLPVSGDGQLFVQNFKEDITLSLNQYASVMNQYKCILFVDLFSKYLDQNIKLDHLLVKKWSIY